MVSWTSAVRLYNHNPQNSSSIIFAFDPTDDNKIAMKTGSNRQYHYGNPFTDVWDWRDDMGSNGCFCLDVDLDGTFYCMGWTSLRRKIPSGSWVSIYGNLPAQPVGGSGIGTIFITVDRQTNRLWVLALDTEDITGDVRYFVAYSDDSGDSFSAWKHVVTEGNNYYASIAIGIDSKPVFYWGHAEFITQLEFLFCNDTTGDSWEGAYRLLELEKELASEEAPLFSCAGDGTWMVNYGAYDGAPDFYDRDYKVVASTDLEVSLDESLCYRSLNNFGGLQACGKYRESDGKYHVIVVTYEAGQYRWYRTESIETFNGVAAGSSPIWQWFWDLTLLDDWLLEFLKSIEVPIPAPPPAKPPFPYAKALGVAGVLGVLGAGAYVVKKYLERGK